MSLRSHADARGVVLKPGGSLRNQINSPDGVTALTIVQAGKAASQSPLRYLSGSEAHPRMTVDGTGGVRLGSGAAATDTGFSRVAAGGIQLGTPAASPVVNVINGAEAEPRVQLHGSPGAVKVGPGGSTAPTVTLKYDATQSGLIFALPSAHSDQFAGTRVFPVSFEHTSGKSGTAVDGTDGGPAFMIRAWPNSANGVNGSRSAGDSPLSDVANDGAFSHYAAFAAMNNDFGTEYDDRGSLTHFHSYINQAAYTGGGALTTPFGVASTNVLTKTAHGLAANDPIQFTALTGGTGLSINTIYFVIASGLTANDFKISATQGGAEINFTTDISAGTYERLNYSEATNLYAQIASNRKGAFSTNIEIQNIVGAGKPARVAMFRTVLQENNAISTYNTANFGAGSRYIDSGSMGIEVLSQGSQRGGTGISIMGSAGWERALRVYNQAQVLVSGIDGEGGVFTRVKAGTFSDSDFRLPADGLLGINSSTQDLEWRAGGVWQRALDRAATKTPVRVASVGNINTASPGATIDGVSMAAGDRVLLKDQTTESQNGIWVWNAAASAMTRALDADAGVEMRGGTTVSVDEGSVANRDSQWMLVITGVPTIGTTALRWTRSNPGYARGADRDPWAAGAAIAETFQRENATTAVSLTDNVMHFAGGCVIPANRTVTNISVYCVVVGTSYVAHWWAIVRQADRVVLERTANSTSLMTINAVNTRALQATYTSPVDVPVWVVIGWDGTTVPQLAGTPAGQAPLNFATPILAGNNASAPTTTPPAVGATLTAPAAGRTQNIYAYLT